MKKILFATTALVASAGIASADVALTGSAEMGIIGGDFDGDALETQFHTDIDVTFTMTGEADNGLTFGASIDLDEADDTFAGGSLAFGNTTQGGETIFISAGGATLTMGDTDGAFDQAMKEVALAGGSINDDHTTHAGYNGNAMFDGTYDGQIARFDYAFSGVTASISAELDDSGTFDPVWGLGIRYEGDFNGVALGVGLGYQAVEDFSAVGISVDAGLSNGLSMAVNYTSVDFDGTDGTHVGLGVGYEMNALAIGVNWGQYTFDGDTTNSGFGLAAAYDLGGGLSAQLGYGHSNFETIDVKANTWSLGLAMSF